MIVGIDSHKDSLAACAVDQLGRQLAAAQFANDPAGHRALLAWARELGPEGRRFGLESSGYFAYALARALLSAGEIVLEVPPGLVDAARRRRPRESPTPSTP
jgi:transposase